MRRTRKRLAPKVYATQAKYIDPLDCGSMVAYSITKRRRLSATMDLSDCNKKITWYFDNDTGDKPIQKIDTVIALLTDFKNDLLNARKSLRLRK